MNKSRLSQPKSPLTARRKLYLAIATQLMLSSQVYAGPTGGQIVSGGGSIEQAGRDTTIRQTTDRLAIDWESFNIAADERVQFVQPHETSVALNRILGNDASRILGQLDANGRVILMNPNGVFFGESATVNVGSLVASGLMIDTNDFINGDLVLSALEGTEGTVVNRGLINASVGGSVALIGQQVKNEGLISATLGAVTLAAGKEAVVSFGNDGLLGVRVTQEILQSELGEDAAVINSGDLLAEGGQILLTASTSRDIFSQAVNSGDMHGKTSVVMHDDGSFTLGGGANVVNTGKLDVSSTSEHAGQVVVLGENITHSGSIHADSHSTGRAGAVEVHALDTTLLTESSTITARAHTDGQGGDIKVLGDRIGVFDQSTLDASGIHGGGNIHIGGGFQGKNEQLRNASRTVVGREAQLRADALDRGDGGDVIVWSDEATAFHGGVSVRGGDLEGDGGFVEISSKGQLSFAGTADRSATMGENGTLLLDPRDIFIVPGDGGSDDDYLIGGQVLFDDIPEGEFFISGNAIASALLNGDVILQATNSIVSQHSLSPTQSPAHITIAVDDPTSNSSLILEAGHEISLGALNWSSLSFDLGRGSLIMSAGGVESENARILGYFDVRTEGDVFLRSSGSIELVDVRIEEIIENIDIASGSGINFSRDRAGFSSISARGDIRLAVGEISSGSISLPSGFQYELPELAMSNLGSEFYGQIAPTFEVSEFGPVSEIVAGGNIIVTAVSDIDFRSFNLHSAGSVNISAIGNINFSDAVVGLGFSAESQGGSISGQGELRMEGSPGASGPINFTASDSIAMPQILAGEDFSAFVFVNAGGEAFLGNDFATNGGNVLIRAQRLNAEGFAIDTTGAGGSGDVELLIQDSFELPAITTGENSYVELRSESGSISGKLAIELGALTQIHAFADVDLQSVTSPGESLLRITSETGDISGEGLNLAGDLELIAGGQAVLADPESKYGGLVSVSANQLYLVTELSDMNFGDLNIGSGGVSAHAVSGASITVHGDLTIEKLENRTQSVISSNDGGSVHILSSDVSVADKLVLQAWGGTVTVGGNVSTAGGDLILQGREFVFTENASIDTTISSANQNDEVATGYVGIYQESDTRIELPNIVTGGCLASDCGNLYVRTAGDVTAQGRNIDISGDGIFEGDDFLPTLSPHAGRLLIDGDGGFIRVGGELKIFAESIDWRSSGDLQLGTITLVGEDLSRFVVDGSITQSPELALGFNGGFADEVINTAPALEFETTGDLILNSTGNHFSQIGIVARDVHLHSASEFNFSNTDVTNLTVQAAANFNQLVNTNVHVSEAFHAEMVDSSSAFYLDNEGNSFGRISVNSVSDSPGFNFAIRFTGDTTLGDVIIENPLAATAQITSQREGGSIVQDESTSIIAQTITVQGDHIHLGGNGSSGLYGASNGVININARRSLVLDGVIEGAAEGVSATRLSIITSDISSTVDILASARFVGDFAETSRFSLNGEDQIVNIFADVPIPLFVSQPAGDTRATVFNLMAPNLNVHRIDATASQVSTINAFGSDNQWIIDDAEGSRLLSGDGVIGFAGIQTLNGGSGNDQFFVENLSSPVSLNGGEGINTLWGHASDNTVNNQWSIDGAFQGTLNELVAFENIQNLEGNDAIDTVIFQSNAVIGDINTGGGDDIIFMASGVQAGLLDGGTGNSVLNLGDLNVVVNILGAFLDGGPDANYEAVNLTRVSEGETTLRGVEGIEADWTIGSEDGDILVSFTDTNGLGVQTRHSNVTRIEGAEGINHFNWLGEAEFAAQIIGGTSLAAVNGQNNTWTIDGFDSGRVTAADDQFLVFEGIANLIGGGNNDLFELMTGGVITGSLEGGAGDNALVIIDPVQTNQWQLGAANSVTGVAEFGGIQTLEGNANNDVFVVVGATDVAEIRGGAGDNSLNWLAGDAVINLADNTANETLIFANIGNFAADASNNNTLIGANTENLWVLSNDVSGNGSLNELTFSGFNSLQGAEGVDTLRGTDVATDWVINGSREGTVSELQFSKMDSLIGGGGNDRFSVRFTDPNLSIDGGGGRNSISVPLSTPYWTLTDRGAGSLIVGSLENPNPSVSFQNISHLGTDFGSGRLELATTNVDGMSVELGGRNGWGSVLNTTDIGADWHLDQLGSGALRFGDSELTFVQVSRISGSENPEAIDRLFGPNESRGAEPLTYQFNSGVYDGFLQDGVLLNGPGGLFRFSGVTEVHGGNGGNTFILQTDPMAATEAYRGTIFTGDGDNTVVIERDMAGLIIGQGGNDLFQIAEGVVFEQANAIEGGEGTNRIVGVGSFDWRITGSFAGEIESVTGFSNIQELEASGAADSVNNFEVFEDAEIGSLIGGVGQSLFQVGPGAVVGNIDGSAGIVRVTLDDNVTITNTLIGGGEGSVLDISAFATAVEYNFALDSVNVELEYEGFEQVIMPESSAFFGGDDINLRWNFADFTVELLDDTGEVLRAGTFDNHTNLRSGTGQNEFILASDSNFNGFIHADVQGNNSLRGSNLNNTWTIDGVNQGRVSDGNVETVFSNIATLIGGTGDDLFDIVTGGSISGSLAGNGGANTLRISDNAVTNSWMLGTQNSVISVAEFSGLQTLVGNANDDLFSITGITDVTSIDGGLGENRLNWSAGDLILNLADNTANETLSFANVGSFAADADNNNILIGADTDNLWSLTAVGSGTLNETSFTGFNHLKGGAGDDTLVGLDADAFWKIGYEDNLDLNTLSYGEQSMVFEGMEHLVGGTGDDFFGFTERLAQVLNVNSVTTVDGGGGQNELLADLLSDWEIGTFGGLVRGRSVDSPDLVFESVQSVIQNGGQFKVSSLNTVVRSYQNKMDRGIVDFSSVEGNMILDLLGPEFRFNGITTVVGNGENGIVTAGDADAIWRIGGYDRAEDGLTPNDWTNFVGRFYLEENFDEGFDSQPDFHIFNFGGIVAGNGNDQFIVDTSFSSISTIINAGGGINTLYANTGNTIDNTWTIDGEYTGTLNTGLQFFNIQHLEGNDGVDTVTFAPDARIESIRTFGGNDIIHIASGVQAGLLDGGTGDSVLNLGDLNAVVDILGNTLEGGDAVYEAVNLRVVSDGEGQLTVRGVEGISAEWWLDGEDAVLIRYTAEGEAREQRYTNVSRLEGAEGENHFVWSEGGVLTGSIIGGASLTADTNQNHNWTIDGENAGTITAADGQTLVFQGIAQLLGGTQNDLFELVTGGAVTGGLHGGGGANALRISNPDQTNAWQLGADNSVTGIAQFSNIQTVEGNANADSFLITGPTDVQFLSGNGGANSVVWSGSALSVSLGSNRLNDNIEFANISDIQGDSGFANSLMGADGDTDWRLSSIHAGTVNQAESEISFNHFQTLLGGTGQNRLFGIDLTGDWAVSGFNSGILGYGADSLSFGGMTHLQGGGADDIFRLTSADAALAGGIFGGGGENRLVGFGDISNQWTVEGSFGGTLEDRLTFADIHHIQGGDQGDRFEMAPDAEIITLRGGNGNDQFFIGAGATLAELYAGGGDDQIDIGANVTAQNLFGESGDNTFVIGTGLNLSGIIDGGVGMNNILDLRAYALNLGDTANFDIEELVGFSFANFSIVYEPTNEGVYFAGDGTNVWYITGANQGRVEILEGPNAGSYQFSGIHTLRGGSGSDTFIFESEAAAITTVIDGGEGAGLNVLDFSAQGLINSWLIDGINAGSVSNSANEQGNIFTNIAYVIGGGNQDTFRVIGEGMIAGIDGGAGTNHLVVDRSETNFWQLGAAAGHSVTGVANFENIQTLTGGAGADTFNLWAPSSGITALDGAGGVNQVVLHYEQGSLLDLQNHRLGETSVQSIARFVATSSGHSIQGSDAANLWRIDGLDSGSVQYLSATGEQSLNIEFEGFESLLGGSGADSFELSEGAQITGQLHGGGGDNSLRGADVDTVWQISGRGQGLVEGVGRFENINNLYGGAGTDTFVMAAEGNISGAIQGSNSGSDRLVHQGDAQIWQLQLVEQNGVSVAGGSVADTSFVGIGHIEAAGADHRLTGGVQNNIWQFGDSPENTYVELNNDSGMRVRFAGMAEYQGGSGDDLFRVLSAAALPGLIDGGAGNNRVDLQGVANDLAIGLAADANLSAGNLAVRLTNIDQLIGNSDYNHVLYGNSDRSYTWTLDGVQTGRLSATLNDQNNQLLAFENISAVVGGDHDDIFQVLSNVNRISIDGGGAQTANMVDYAQVNGNLQVNLSQGLSAGEATVSNVGIIRGNNSGVSSLHNAELIATDADNQWTIAPFEDAFGLVDGVNDGQLYDGNQTITFIDFNRLTGGAGSDVFNLNGGIITGQIDGGAGNDVFNIDITGINPGLHIVGGAGNDQLNFSGGGEDYLVRYAPAADGGEFRFSSADSAYLVSYQSVEQVQQHAQVETLQIDGSAAQEIIAIGNGLFQVDQGAAIHHRNQRNLVVNAGANDTVVLIDHINLPGTFAVRNGSLTTRDPAATSVTAEQLVLENTRLVGSADARIRTNVQDLSLRNVVGDVYLQEQAGLNFAEYVSSGKFDLLLLNGDLTSTTAISAAGDFLMNAQRGNIELTGENQLSGDVTLLAAGAVTVHNNTHLNLAGVTAESLDVRSQRDIRGNGPLRVAGTAVMQASGDILLNDPLNDFHRLQVTDARDVSVVDQNAIELMGITARGAVSVDAVGINVQETIRANAIALNANQATAELHGNLNTLGGGNISVDAQHILQYGDILSGGSTRLTSATAIAQNGSIQAGANVSATAQDGQIVMAPGTTTAGAGVNYNASGNLQIENITASAVNLSGGERVATNGDVIASSGDIQVDSGIYVMSADTRLQAQQGAIRISATDTASVGGQVSAATGVQIATANGDVHQTGNISVVRGNVEVSAGGMGDLLMSSEARIAVGTGNITIEAGNDVVIGSVIASNTATVRAREGQVVDGNGSGTNVKADTLIVEAGAGIGSGDALETEINRVTAGTDTGNLAISNRGDLAVDQAKTDSGNIRVDSTGDISLGGGSVNAGDGGGRGEGGNVAIISTQGGVKQTGPVTQPAIIAANTVDIDARQGSVGKGGMNIDAYRVRVIAAKEGELSFSSRVVERIMYFHSGYKFEDHIVSLAPLEDINPAVFSNVRGYFYNDISVRLPQDQRYDDDEI